MSSVCQTCRSPKGALECDVCFEMSCKSCVQYLDPSAIAFLAEKKETLTHSRYCARCYDSLVAPELDHYNETLERAREVTFLTENYKGRLPILKKSKITVQVTGIEDRDEAILRLAFIAAEQGYNSLIESEVTSRKIRDHAYQRSEWDARGTPATLDIEKLRIDEYREEVWRRGK